MAMEGVRSSLAALLFLTLVVLAAARGGDDAAAVEVEQCHPLADDEPYVLVTFQNIDSGEEIRLLADQRSELPSASGFANRSGHWFYAIRDREEGKGKRRRLPLPLPQPDNRSRTKGLWATLGVLANTTAASDSDGPAAADDDDEQAGYVLVGMQTSGGDKIRLVAVADQRYVSVTGFAQGFSNLPHWFFREGERHRLLTTVGNGSSHGSSHAEVVASNLLAALMDAGKACCGG